MFFLHYFILEINLFFNTTLGYFKNKFWCPVYMEARKWSCNLRVTVEVNKPPGTSPRQKTKCLLKNHVRVNWESTQRLGCVWPLLRMCTAVAENLSAVSNTHIRLLTTVPGIQHPLVPSMATAHMCICPTHARNLK